MTDAIRHRGPDDDGAYLASGIALGQRRLSIIDLGGGHQPLSNEDGTVWLTFNGEIYNYRELRPTLEAKGHTFATDSDTEVIVHAYEEYGTACVDHLRGMFAFAIWDEPQRRLFLARDRIGQKPLFYKCEPERLLFASELKAILEVPGVSREVDPQAIDLFLAYQYVPHPHCIFKGYNKLPPAHWAMWENGSFRTQRFWQAPYSDDSSFPTDSSFSNWDESRWRSELRERLTEAVRLRMRSDVALGAFLSGGVDSTLIAGLMQSLSDRPIHTFSIGFPIAAFDESAFAKQAATHLGTEHHEYVVEPSALDTLPELIWHFDEPFGDSSAIPMMSLSRVTREHVTVALSGDGGDELFAGYDRYKAVALAARIDRMPAAVKRLFASRLWEKLPASVEQRSFRRRLKKFIRALGQPAELRYLRWIGIFDEDRRRRLYTPEFAASLGGSLVDSFLMDAYAQCEGRDIVTRTTCADVHSYLPCDILTKVDIATMAASLEARSPFLDHHVVELAARMPLSLKQRDGRGKWILTEEFGEIIPKSIQHRKKMGFGVPIDHWFRDELKPMLYDVLLDERATSRGYFDPAEVRRLIEEHQSEQWDHAYRLWGLLVLESWLRMFVDPS